MFQKGFRMDVIYVYRIDIHLYRVYACIFEVSDNAAISVANCVEAKTFGPLVVKNQIS